MTELLTEKYRPRSLADIVGNKEVIEALSSIADAGMIPHMLFYGPPGTGKTTAIRAISNGLPRMSVLELNASDERGISTVRETIKEFASTFSKTMKLVILDEVDMMSRDAQNALRRVMEDYSKNTRFCLIANHLKKIIPPILSRCTKFRFRPVEWIEDRIREICIQERIKYTDDGIKAISETSDGDMRKAINDIQGISSSFDIINESNTYKFNGLVSRSIYSDLFDSLLTMNIMDLKSKLRNLRYEGVDCTNLISNLGMIVRRSDMKNKMKILKDLSDIEYRMSLGCNESVQSSGIISVFILNRKSM